MSDESRPKWHRALGDPSGEPFNRLVDAAQKLLAMVGALAAGVVFVLTGGFAAARVQLRLLEAELARSDGRALEVGVGEVSTENTKRGSYAHIPWTVENLGTEAVPMHVQAWLLPVIGTESPMDDGTEALPGHCTPWLPGDDEWTRADRPVRRVCHHVGRWVLASSPADQREADARWTTLHPGVTEDGALLVPIRCDVGYYVASIVAFDRDHEAPPDPDAPGPRALTWSAQTVFVPDCEG